MQATRPTTYPAAGPTRWRRILGFVAERSLLIALAFIFMVPIAIVTFTSFMSSKQTLTSSIWPSPWVLGTYGRAFVSAPLLTWFGNSFLYAALSTVGMLVTSIPAAYALARVRFKFDNVLFGLIIVAMLLPPQVAIVPLYIFWAKLGLVGTLWPLIIPYFFGVPFAIFLLRQFFLTIPNDYCDAARVDGTGEWGVMIRVVCPMAMPGIAAASMFTFFHSWNDYFGPLVFVSANSDNWPVAYGLATFHGRHGTDWGTTMAVTVLATLPVLILFFMAQKAFVQGITLTGVK